MFQCFFRILLKNTVSYRIFQFFQKRKQIDILIIHKHWICKDSILGFIDSLHLAFMQRALMYLIVKTLIYLQALQTTP
ncbi:hypothetical protein pb186bvf_006297 [Paramecium bursaria]